MDREAIMAAFGAYQMKEFRFAERDAIIIYPSGKANGRMILKTEYLDAFPAFDQAMLGKGYHIIHIFHRTRWATDEENDIMAEFVRYCAKEYGLDERCILEGMSCGGLQAAKFAETYPELTAVVYLDAPVLNILSMAGLGECSRDAVPSFWCELVAAYGVSHSTIVNFRKSPIDNMQPLIDHNIPIIMLYGDSDDVVLYNENGRVLEDFYRANGGNLKVIQKAMVGHHPHGLHDPAPIIEFVEENLR